MSDLPLVLSLVSILFTAISMPFAILAYCKVVGMEKATHKIEYITPEQMECIKTKMNFRR